MKKWDKKFPVELRISLSYLAIAILWIYYSDQWASKFASNQEALMIISTYKGWLYVVVTSLMLYFTLHKIFKQKDDYQNKLAESEVKYRNISMNQPGIVFQYRMTDADNGYFSFISDGARKMLVLGNDVDLNTINLYSFIHPDDRDLHKEAMRNAYINKNGWRYDGRLVCDNGNIRYFYSETHLQITDTEYIFDGIIFDVTEKKQAEELLISAFEEQQMMLEASPMAIAIWDYNGNLDYINNCFFKLTGYSIANIPDVKHWYMKVYPNRNDRKEMMRKWRDEINIALKSGALLKNIETKIVCANGDIKDVVIFSSIIHNKVFTMIDDITKRKAAEIEIIQHREHLLDLVKERTGELEKSRIAALSLMQDAVQQRERAENALRESEIMHLTMRESEEKHKIIFENSPLAMMYIDKNGIVSHANNKVVDIIGYPTDKIIGNSIYNDKNASLLFSHLHDAINGKDCLFEGVIQQINRGEIYLRILINPTNPTCPPSDIILTIEDITDRMKFENDLRIARDAAESANRAKTTFLANMSHEIRTPMNAISGYAQLLRRDESLTKLQQEHLATINRSSEHLLSLINDILEMSKIEAGRITLNNSLLDLTRMVSDIDMMFKIRSKEKGINLQINYGSNLPSVIKADAGKIRQVLINLLSNAVKFTENGKITVDIACAETADLQHNFHIDVTDTGVGIADNDRESIFGEFEQTESGRNQMEGTGLGLSISRAFARLMGGDINITRSEIDKGTTFRFTFPAESASADQIVKMSERKRNIDHISKLSGEKRILVVDDDTNSREVLMKLLVDVGFIVSIAADKETRS